MLPVLTLITFITLYLSGYDITRWQCTGTSAVVIPVNSRSRVLDSLEQQVIFFSFVVVVLFFSWGEGWEMQLLPYDSNLLGLS